MKVNIFILKKHILSIKRKKHITSIILVKQKIPVTSIILTIRTKHIASMIRFARFVLKIHKKLVLSIKCITSIISIMR